MILGFALVELLVVIAIIDKRELFNTNSYMGLRRWNYDNEPH